jgi:hypothetical protein
LESDSLALYLISIIVQKHGHLLYHVTVSQGRSLLLTPKIFQQRKSALGCTKTIKEHAFHQEPSTVDQYSSCIFYSDNEGSLGSLF